jgi:parvulin-like peptidyl-prolyl isomerase
VPNRICFLAVSITAAFLLSGCGIWDDITGKNDAAIPSGPEPKAVGNLPAVSGGMVLPVNKEIITIDEVISPLEDDLKEAADYGDYLNFRSKARPLVEKQITTKISNIVLYQKAKKEAREGIDEQLDKADDSEVRQFVAGFNGDYAKAENAIKKDGMTWKTFTDFQKRSLMVQSYLSEEFKDKKPITYSELVAYYNKIKDEAFLIEPKMQFRLIDIMPSKVKLADPNETRRAAATRVAGEVSARLKAGNDFAALAKEFSNDSKAELGGLWSPVSLGSLARPYDAIEREIAKLKPGEVAGPVDLQGHIFIIKLESRQAGGYEPFETVQHEVQTRLKLQRKKDSVDNLTTKLMSEADIGDREQFTELCLQKAFQKIKDM